MLENIFSDHLKDYDESNMVYFRDPDLINAAIASTSWVLPLFVSAEYVSIMVGKHIYDPINNKLPSKCKVTIFDTIEYDSETSRSRYKKMIGVVEIKGFFMPFQVGIDESAEDRIKKEDGGYNLSQPVRGRVLSYAVDDKTRRITEGSFSF